MLRGIRSRMTYANVTASLALFIALGGVSYAAVKLPNNSVGSAQIKSNAVTGAKVKNSSLTGSDIKNKSLSAADFNGSLQGAQGPAGAQGPKGDAGPKGDTGPVGPSEMERFRVKLAFGQTQTLFTAGTLTFSARCVQNATDPGGALTRDFVELLVATSQDGGTLANGGGGGLNGENPTDFLDTGTAEDKRAVAWVSTTTGSSYADIENAGAGYGMSAVDPNGVAVIFPDPLTGSVGLFGTDCLLAGVAVIP